MFVKMLKLLMSNIQNFQNAKFYSRQIKLVYSILPTLLAPLALISFFLILVYQLQKYFKIELYLNIFFVLAYRFLKNKLLTSATCRINIKGAECSTDCSSLCCIFTIQVD